MALPQGFEKLKKENGYWKTSEFLEGDNKLRIVGEIICGWLEWDDGKPRRYRSHEKPATPINPEKLPEAFWAMQVWDYRRESLFILEIKQSGILKALTALELDNDWGDLNGYDIKVTKTGSGMKTRYSVSPLPHKPLSNAQLAAIEANPVNLEALYVGGNPFGSAGAVSSQGASPRATHNVSVAEVVRNTFGSPREELRERMEASGVDGSFLDAYLTSLANLKGQSEDAIIKSVMKPELAERFRGAYAKFVADSFEPVQAKTA